MTLTRMIAKGLLATLAGYANAALVTMSYEPVWPEMTQNGFQIPIRVEIKNNGTDTIGSLTAASRYGSVLYPVELPKGADKVIVVYLPPSALYDSTKLELKTSIGNVTSEVEIKGGDHEQAKYVGVVTSTAGVVSTLRTKIKGKELYWDTSTSPENAPDRSIGYKALSVLILGDGSERLSDAAVSAIQRYVLSGGQLVVTGGASAPLLRDPRWQAVLPIIPTSTANLQTVGALTKAAAETLNGPVTVTTGALRPGAKTTLSQDGTPLAAELQVGLGRVVFWAFDPFTAPIQTWRGRDVLIKQIVNADTKDNSFLTQGFYSPTKPGAQKYDHDDPFSIEAPPAYLICLILVGFLVTVVPLNFFTLQKLNRRELAWLTIPCISLGFSAMIFATAGALYKTKMARATKGLVVIHEGMEDAVFVGKQDLFFPQAGVYNLNLNGVESAYNSSQAYEMWDSPPMLGGTAELIDIGQVVVPRLEATNLTFRSFFLTQTVPFTGKIIFNPIVTSDKSDWVVKGKLINSTPLQFRAAELCYKDSSKGIGDIGPGQTVMIDVRVPKQKGVPNDAEQQPPLRGGLALLSAVEGIEVGTSLGMEPPLRRDCKLLYTWGRS